MATGDELPPVPLPAAAVALSLDPASDRVWAATADGQVVLVAGELGLALTATALRPPAQDLAVSAPDGYLYALHRASYELLAPTVLAVLDARTLAPVATIPLSPGPAAIATDARTGRAFAASVPRRRLSFPAPHRHR